MSTLITEFLGITFPNPFLIAAGPPTANGAMVIEAFKAGWGGAVLKTIGLVPTKHPSPTQSRPRNRHTINQNLS